MRLRVNSDSDGWKGRLAVARESICFSETRLAEQIELGKVRF
jgi:hypothetical protein